MDALEHKYRRVQAISDLLIHLLLGIVIYLVASDKPIPPQIHHYTIIQQVSDTIEVTRGLASWYGPGFNGRVTANGETYNQDSLTAASTSYHLELN